MNISVQFNRFYHSRILTDLFRRCGVLVFRDWIDTNTGRSLEFFKGEDFHDVDDLKQLLKLMNINYSVDETEEKKISTSEIDSKALTQHIEWVLRIAGENGIELPLVTEEWEHLLNDSGIRK